MRNTEPDKPEPSPRPAPHDRYCPPRLTRVALATARTATGHYDADVNHCTQHYHDQATCPWP